MITKLTLSINEEVIKKAKQLSRRKGKSISKMVEEYLTTVSDREGEKETPLSKLSGILKDKIPADVDIKEVKRQYLTKKYGL